MSAKLKRFGETKYQQAGAAPLLLDLTSVGGASCLLVTRSFPYCAVFKTHQHHGMVHVRLAFCETEL